MKKDGRRKRKAINPRDVDDILDVDIELKPETLSVYYLSYSGKTLCLSSLFLETSGPGPGPGPFDSIPNSLTLSLTCCSFSCYVAACLSHPHNPISSLDPADVPM
jgi:hypothetical protein